jgi:hypothetical protein
MRDKPLAKLTEHQIRMRALERAADKESAAFARWVGISPQHWNHALNGETISLPVARAIKRRLPDITLDWLILGDYRGVSSALADRLRLAVSEIETTFGSIARASPKSKTG